MLSVSKIFSRNSVQISKHLARKQLHTTSCRFLFWEKDEKGGYKDQRPPMTIKERMRLGLHELKQEVGLWSNEIKEKLEFDPLMIYRPGEVDVVWQPECQEDLDKWIVTSDSDHNEGSSHCSFTLSKSGKGLFEGNLNLQAPKDGRVKRAGYCNIKTHRVRKSFKRDGFYDWSSYNMLVMKVRGDGRSYLLNIHTKGYFDIAWNDIYHYVLYTRGGPYWQVAKIPFSKFFLSSKGRVQDRQQPLPMTKITNFGITAADRFGGDFSLEIDFIGMEFDPNHNEEFAYEMYELPKYIAGH